MLPDCVSDSDGVEEEGSKNSKSNVVCRFGTAGVDELARVNAGGHRRSWRAEQWAAKAFDKWRSFCGYSTVESIADLSENEDIKPLIDMLVLFVLEIKKKNGLFYNPTTISGMMRSIGRLIRARQEQRVIETSVPPGLPFNILTDIRYARVRVAGDEAVKRSARAGLGRETLKSDFVTLAEEQEMLLSAQASPETAAGLTCRFSWYTMKNFFSRGASELRNVDSSMFSLVLDDLGDEVLRFTPGCSKNWSISVQQCSSESFRKPVLCSIKDVILTYKSIVSHWPVFQPYELPHPFFLTPKSPKSCKGLVWFSKVPIGRNTLAKLTKTLFSSVPSANLKRITNKTRRMTQITRMEEAQVPREKVMLVTGHRDSKSYAKYSTEDKCITDRAVQRVIAGECVNGNKLSYVDALNGETKRLDNLKAKDLKAAKTLASAAVTPPTLVQEVQPFQAAKLAAPSSQVHPPILMKESVTCSSADLQSAGTSSHNLEGLSEQQYMAFQQWMLKKQVKKNSEKTVFKNISNCSIVNVVVNGGDCQSATSLLESVTRSSVKPELDGNM